jgi:ferredoxin
MRSARHGGTLAPVSLRIVIDDDACTGHGRCYALAPAVFEPDDIGRSVAVSPTVAPEHEAAAETAAANCPERAITLIRE